MKVSSKTFNSASEISSNSKYLKRVGISQTEAWEIGYKNTFDDTKIFSMASLELEDFGVDPRMYIFTNESGYLGASAILNSRALKEFAITFFQMLFRCFLQPHTHMR